MALSGFPLLRILDPIDGKNPLSVCLSDPLQYMKRLEFQEGDRAVEGGGISAGGEHQRPRRPRGEARGVGKGQPGHGHRSEGEYRAGLPNSHAVD